jgi:hypothetical protein
VALNLAEHRRGLFVVLDQEESTPSLVAPWNLLENQEPGFFRKMHYLLRKKSVIEMELTVLQSIAGIDGGIVMDRLGRLLAVDAILRTSGEPVTVAVYALQFGLAFKINSSTEPHRHRASEKLTESANSMVTFDFGVCFTRLHAVPSRRQFTSLSSRRRSIVSFRLISSGLAAVPLCSGRAFRSVIG